MQNTHINWRAPIGTQTGNEIRFLWANPLHAYVAIKPADAPWNGAEVREVNVRNGRDNTGALVAFNR